MDLYREIILDHYKHPRNFGSMSKPDAKVEEGNVTCGDRIVMEIKLKTNSDKLKPVVADVRFSGTGCAISMASASMLTEKVKGMRIDDIFKLTGQDIIGMLGTTLTPSRMKCATLSLEVLHKVVQRI